MKRVIASGMEPLRFDPASENDKRTQLEHVIIVFARVMAIILLIRGIMGWANILEITDFGGYSFSEAPVYIQCTIVAFTLMSFVSAIGLWILASWGPVLWLFLVIGDAFVHIAFVVSFGSAPLLLTFNAFTVVFYLFLMIPRERQKNIYNKR
jgi:hypothetical protein